MYSGEREKKFIQYDLSPEVIQTIVMSLGSGTVQINSKPSESTTVKEGSEIATCIKMAVNRLQQGLRWC